MLRISPYRSLFEVRQNWNFVINSHVDTYLNVNAYFVKAIHMYELSLTVDELFPDPQIPCNGLINFRLLIKIFAIMKLMMMTMMIMMMINIKASTNTYVMFVCFRNFIRSQWL